MQRGHRDTERGTGLGAGALLLLWLAAAAPGWGAELTGTEIVRRAERILRGESNRGTYEMTVTTPRWERTLKLKVWQKGLEKTFIRILEPPKEAGIGSLKLGYQMWNYIPRVERVIKIPPSMMMQPWMGSDFTNDDLVKESSIVHDYTHRLLGVESLGGERAYRVEAVPKPQAPVVWGRIVLWIRQADFMPLRQDYYDERGRLIRRLVFSDFRRLHGRLLPTRWEMIPLTEKKKGRRTVIRVLDVEYNIPLDDGIFTLRNLKRP